jgi:hypothetical protein
MPPKPKKKKGDQTRKVHARAQSSSDDDSVEEELKIDYGQISNVGRIDQETGSLPSCQSCCA